MRNPLPRVVRATAPHNLRYVQVPASSVRAGSTRDRHSHMLINSNRQQ